MKRSYNLRIRLKVKGWSFDFRGWNFIHLICVTCPRFHSNILVMFARTCSHFTLTGSHHLELMPMFSRFRLARIKYIILSTQNRTHRSISVSSRYFFPLSRPIWQGGWDPFSPRHALPSWAHSLDLARPSTLLSVFIALRPWQFHYVLGVFFAQHNPWRCRPSSQPSGQSPSVAC